MKKLYIITYTNKEGNFSVRNKYECEDFNELKKYLPSYTIDKILETGGEAEIKIRIIIGAKTEMEEAIKCSENKLRNLDALLTG